MNCTIRFKTTKDCRRIEMLLESRGYRIVYNSYWYKDFEDYEGNVVTLEREMPQETEE